MADYSSPQLSGWNASQLGFDPSYAPASPEPQGMNLFGLADQGLQELGNIAYQVVPDAAIAAGRAALGQGSYADNRSALDMYKRDQQMAATPSQVVDPAFKQGPGGIFYDNPEQQQMAMDKTIGQVMGVMGGGPIKPRPGANFSEVGKGFMHGGKIYDTGAFHDLNKLPQGLQNIPDAYLENPAGLQSGWILRGENTRPAQPGTSPEFPRFVDRPDYGKPGPNMLGRPEFPTTAANEPLPEGRVVGRVGPMFAATIPEEAAQQPKYFSRPSSPSSPMPESGLPDMPSNRPEWFDSLLEAANKAPLPPPTEGPLLLNDDVRDILSRYSKQMSPVARADQGAINALKTGSPANQTMETNLSMDQIRKAIEEIQKSLGRPIQFNSFGTANEPMRPQ